MVANAALCTATYAAPLPSVTRRTGASDTRTPVKNPNASTARPQGIHVPNRTTLSGGHLPASRPSARPRRAAVIVPTGRVAGSAGVTTPATTVF